jgi:hypothetical protein
MSMKSVNARSVGATIVAACAAAAIAAVAGSGKVTETAAADVGMPPAVQALSPSFSDAQSSPDLLPSFLVNGRQAMDGIDQATTRLAGNMDGTRYWIAENHQGQACLIMLLPGDEQFASMTCGDAASVWSSGLGLQVNAPGSALNVYFVPTGYEASLEGYSQAGAQILVGDASEPQQDLSIDRDPNSSAPENSVSKYATSSELNLQDFAPVTPTDG